MGSMPREEWFPAVLGLLDSKEASLLTLVETNGLVTLVGGTSSFLLGSLCLTMKVYRLVPYLNHLLNCPPRL